MKTIAFAFLVLAGCASADPPAVRSATTANASAQKPHEAPAAGMARVVLIRPESQCDSSIYPIIVDENGHFVAEMSQESHVSIDVPPGNHVLFAWPNVDPRVEKVSEFDPVGVVGLSVNAGDTRYVAVEIPHRSSAQCWHITVFDLHRLRADDPDLGEWLASTKPITIDRAAGEAELAKDPALVQEHLASGRREIERAKAERKERSYAQRPTTN